MILVAPRHGADGGDDDGDVSSSLRHQRLEQLDSPWDELCGSKQLPTSGAVVEERARKDLELSNVGLFL